MDICMNDILIIFRNILHISSVLKNISANQKTIPFQRTEKTKNALSIRESIFYSFKVIIYFNLCSYSY